MQTDLTGAWKITLNTTELREEEKKTWEKGKGLNKHIKRALNIRGSLYLIKNKMLCELQSRGFTFNEPVKQCFKILLLFSLLDLISESVGWCWGNVWEALYHIILINQLTFIEHLLCPANWVKTGECFQTGSWLLNKLTS